VADPWVVPVVTGALGIAGIASTFFTARLQHRAQVELVRSQRTSEVRDLIRAERRRIYTKFLEISAETIKQCGTVRSTPLDDPTRTDVLERTRDCLAKLGHLMAEMYIIAGDEAGHCAEELLARLLGHWQVCKGPEFGAANAPRTEYTESITRTTDARQSLIAAMRRDLLTEHA
jgi:hypothetical protein